MKTYNGNLVADDLKMAIVVGRFNDFITNRLLSGALDALKRHGMKEENITIAYCPGAFELPLVAKKFVDKEDVDAVICLGAVLRGATSHYDLVCNEAAKGIAATSLASGKPILFGLVTADTLEQAIERAGTKSGNKGFDAAMSAVEMCNLLKEI
ncbi:MAG: 6,7-dimethyl-8-ribityllumazine synthase [Negativicoccus massiliensis]|nr:6,7-dimethyl-8-ribityllumazine synthase [Negativicoccus massiliensis]